MSDSILAIIATMNQKRRTQHSPMSLGTSQGSSTRWPSIDSSSFQRRTVTRGIMLYQSVVYMVTIKTVRFSNDAYFTVNERGEGHICHAAWWGGWFTSKNGSIFDSTNQSNTNLLGTIWLLSFGYVGMK